MKKTVNFLLYGNFFIASCALAQTLQTCRILHFKTESFNFLSIFITAATFVLYNLHKPITFLLKQQVIENQRFRLTKQFSRPLSILTVLAVVLCCFLFFKLKILTQLILVAAAFLSLGYILPVLGGGRRLRDLAFLKIFLIAIVWSVVTVILPTAEMGGATAFDGKIGLLFIERAAFIFALTMPFDIRDMAWDSATEVQTIPLSIGIGRAKYLAFAALIFSFSMSCVLCKMGIYSIGQLAAVGFSLVVSGGVVSFSNENRSDYFFYGLTDGMMWLQSGLLFFAF